MLSDKFIYKYMRLAKQVGEDCNPCLSRKIGSVIVNPKENRIVGTGYNGPPKGAPHCNSKEHLSEYMWPQLSIDEKLKLLQHSQVLYDDYKNNNECIDTYQEKLCESEHFGFVNCKICPRRLIGAKSGQRLELCSCVHSETNAIINSSESLYDCHIFCWCGVPCRECAKLIINSGISRVYCLKESDQFHEGNEYYRFDLSNWLFRKSNVSVVELNESDILNSNDY